MWSVDWFGKLPVAENPAPRHRVHAVLVKLDSRVDQNVSAADIAMKKARFRVSSRLMVSCGEHELEL